MRLGSCVAVALASAGSCSSHSTPNLGTSTWLGSSARKGKKTKNKNKQNKNLGVLSRAFWQIYSEDRADDELELAVGLR